MVPLESLLRIYKINPNLSLNAAIENHRTDYQQGEPIHGQIPA